MKDRHKCASEFRPKNANASAFFCRGFAAVDQNEWQRSNNLFNFGLSVSAVINFVHSTIYLHLYALRKMRPHTRLSLAPRILASNELANDRRRCYSSMFFNHFHSSNDVRLRFVSHYHHRPNTCNKLTCAEQFIDSPANAISKASYHPGNPWTPLACRTATTRNKFLLLHFYFAYERHQVKKTTPNAMFFFFGIFRGNFDTLIIPRWQSECGIIAWEERWSSPSEQAQETKETLQLAR